MTHLISNRQLRFPVAVKRAIPLLFALFAVSAHAEAPVLPAPFDVRVQLAKDVEADERFKTYKTAMIRRNGRYLARTMRACRSIAPAPEQKSVVLVAEIEADGRASAVEVKPDNALGNCFATGFSSARYPKPPAYPGRQGFPVMMKISVAH